MPPGAAAVHRPRLLLGLVLGVSLILRVALVLSGGQGYWPDEVRYERSREAAAALRHGNARAAVRAVARPDHLLFGFLGLAPACLELATGPDDRVPALFFSLFSVASIGLLYSLARRLGENERAALLSALLLAASTAQLYGSRHLLPYDASLCLGLAALLVAVRASPSIGGSVLCGLLSAAALLTYNGYFLLAGTALAIHALGARGWRIGLGRGLAAGAAFALPFAAIALADALRHGAFLRQWLAFSNAVTQGRFGEGGGLPFAYLWHAEHLLTVLWAFAFAFASVRLWHGDRSRSLAFGVAGILLVYGGLVAGSVALERFVVYGRQVRQLVPLACLLSGVTLDRLASGGPAKRRVVVAVLVAVIAQSALNFRTPIAQVFPREFRKMAERIPSSTGAPRRLLYADHIYPVPAPPPDSGHVLLARPHPLQFLPYPYEGYTPEERAALRATDIRMRLVEIRTRN